MGQKINPISIRIPIHRKMDSFWFDEKNYKHNFFQEIFIRNYIESMFHFLKKYPTKLIIRHFPHKISLYGFFLPWNCFNKGFRYQIQKTHFPIRKKQKILKNNKIKSSFHNYYRTNSHFLFYSEGFLHNKQQNFVYYIKKKHNILQNFINKILSQEKLNFYNIIKNLSKNYKKINPATNINNYSKNLEKLNLLFIRKKYYYPLISINLQIHWLILQLWKSQKLSKYFYV